MASTRERRRADGTVAYLALFRHNGKQTSETFDSERARARFIRNVDNLGVDTALSILDATDASAPDVPTFTQLAAEHIDLIDAEPYTRRRYRGYLKSMTALATIPVDSITTETIERWVRAQVTAGASPKTIKNKHGLISGILKRAVRRGYLPANPCEDVTLPRVRRAEMTALDPGELAILIGSMPPRWHPLVATLAATAMRWGEATALQVQDLDLDRLRIRVHRAWKRGEDGWESSVTKTVKSDRTVTLSPDLARILLPVIEDRAPSALVFTNTRGGAVRHSSFHETVWKPALILANGGDPWADKKRGLQAGSPWRRIQPADPPLGKTFGIHALRHTGISQMLASGLDLKTVQDQAGHESITTTADRYGHVSAAQRLQVAGAQSAMLAQAFPILEDEEDPRQIEG